MTTEAKAGREAGGVPAAVWAGLFVPPAALALNFQIAFMLVPWACERRATWALMLVAAVFLAVDAAAGLLAWREWRRAGGGRPGDGDDPASTSRLLAVVGLLLSALFFLLMLLQGVAMLILDPCQL